MAVKAVNLAVKAMILAVKEPILAVKAANFGSQGGSQDVVEEWLKEDEHTSV